MHYRIDYGDARRTGMKKVPCLRLPILIVLCFVIFLVLANQLWPEGSALIGDAVLYVRNSSAVESLEQFADNFRDGESVASAFSFFCQSLLP